MQHRHLDQLAIGESAIVVAVEPAAGDGTDDGAVRRLRELGFDEGTRVELLHRAPFGGDPIAVLADDMLVALRRAQARLVRIELAPAAGGAGRGGLAQAAE